MIPIDFEGCNVIVARDQPEYVPIPAVIDREGQHGLMTFCWKLSWSERLGVLLRGELWHQVLTFGNRLQPQKLSVERPRMEE